LVNRDDLVQYIYCSTIFEEEVAKAYQKISEKISDKEVAYLLEFIAKDSFKHASALKALNAQLANRTKLWRLQNILRRGLGAHSRRSKKICHKRG